MGLFDFLRKNKNTGAENTAPKVNETIKEEIIEETVINNTENGNNDIDIVADETNDNITEVISNEQPEEIAENISDNGTVEVLPVEETTEDVNIVSEEPTITEVIEESVSDESVEEPATIESEKPVPNVVTEEPVQEKKMGFFAKIKSGLSKTRNNIMSSVDNVLKAFVKIDEDLFEELEEALIMADIGVETSVYIIEKLREKVKAERVSDASEVKGLLVKVISEILEKDDEPLELPSPSVILVIGVNGVGKTTTIGKLAHNYQSEGKSVLLAAADTFRAAAIDQLQIWGDRNNCDVIKHQENSDPAAVVFDAVNAAKARKADILICDTAGRLHNKKNLMEELRKIAKVIEREYPEAHTEVFLVLDSTTGQNAIQQAKLFSEVANITGLILTKLDGTAKGGIVLAIKHDMNIPVRYIGVGEQINDLQPFNSTEFSKALFDAE